MTKERKTTRTFDVDSGVWTGWYNTNPKDTVVCDLWRLFFVEPSYPELPEKANKKAKEENESARADLFTAAKDAAQAIYDSLTLPARTALGAGVGRIVGDKLNTSKAETDSGKVQDARKDWVALYSGETRVRAGGDTPMETARKAIAGLEAAMNAVTVKASEKWADDSAIWSQIATARGESVEDFTTWLDAEVARKMGPEEEIAT